MAIPSEMITSAAFILMDALIEKRPRRWWRHVIYEEKTGSSLFAALKFQQISGHYKNFTRMSPTDFEYCINLIGPRIQKRNTNCREAISVQDRLAVTLRYLATGDSFTSLQYLFRISKQAISKIIPEVCEAIIDGLKEHVKIPTSSEEWMKIENDFKKLWNFPHAIGALDGKHILLQCPFNSGTEYYNYKSHFSIVLLALVDADYNFLYVNIGAQGRISDGGVMNGCSLNTMIEENKLGIPLPRALENRVRKIPYMFLVDSAFAMTENTMKPYAGIHPKGSRQRIFNYRQSRARRVVENGFGILSSVFRVFRKPMLLQPEKAQIISMAAIYLHNFLRRSCSKSVYTPPGAVDIENNVTGEITPGSWRDDIESMTSFLPIPVIPRRSAEHLKENREELADYFMNEGKLSWQNHYA